MTTYAHAAGRLAQRVLPGAAARLEGARPARLLAGAVAVQWLTTLGLALVVRHDGWTYARGGGGEAGTAYDLGRLLGQGRLGHASVGYGWPAVLVPFARAAGARLPSALPAIVLLDVLVLAPLALFALYGIAARIGGRLFGYWAVVLWLALPFVGIAYANVGYHRQYTEQLLPQAFGLAALPEMPATVATVVSAYFCSRVLFDERPRLLDGLAAGIAAGAAIALYPSAALVLPGIALALLVARRLAMVLAFAAGLAPALATLAVWRERGLGRLTVHLGDLSWTTLGSNVDGLREHFWSGRLLVWMMLAGIVALARRSPRAAVLVGGWFLAFALVKGSSTGASTDDGGVFRMMMPSFPAFVLLVAALPLLLPHVPARLGTWRPGFASPPAKLRATAAGAAVVLSALLPLAAIAAASR